MVEFILKTDQMLRGCNLNYENELLINLVEKKHMQYFKIILVKIRKNQYK